MTGADDGKRFAGTDFEFWLIYIAVALVIAVVAAVDRAFGIALLSLGLASMCALFAWRSRRRRTRGRRG
jgi:Flp pilus assembly protein TadB